MQHEEQKKREVEEAAVKWKEISEHRREKEAEQRQGIGGRGHDILREL